VNSEDIDAFPTALLEAFTFRDRAGKGGIYPSHNGHVPFQKDKTHVTQMVSGIRRIRRDPRHQCLEYTKVTSIFQRGCENIRANRPRE